MTLEEYKQQPYKTDGNGDTLSVGDCWYDIPRHIRQTIKAKLRSKGKCPPLYELWG